MNAEETISKHDIEDIIALTPMQQGMLYHYLNDPFDHLYYEELCLRLSGPVNRNHFQQAWQHVIDSHQMLRTLFRWRNIANPVQIILKKNKLKINYIDLTTPNAEPLEHILSELKQEKCDLQQVPFLITLCRLDENKHALIISHHHILYDGWSNSILLKDFFKTYHCLCRNEKLQSSSPPAIFKQYIKWLANRDTSSEEEFWHRYLEGFPGASTSPVSHPHSTYGSINIQFPANVLKQWETIVKQNNTTTAALLYTGWAVLLQQLHNSTDVLFDTTVSGRTPEIEGIRHVVGLFINTVPLRVKQDCQQTPTRLLGHVSHSLQQRQSYEFTSVTRIKQYMETLKTQPPLNTVVVIENYPLNIQQHTHSLQITGFSHAGSSSYDLTVIITLLEQVEITITYDKTFLPESLIQAIARHLQHILTYITRQAPAFSHDQREQLNRLLATRSVTGRRVTYTPPGNDFEETLLELWQEVLFVNKRKQREIGIHHNFFHIGGHSLKATLLASALQQQFNIKFPLSHLFQYPTVALMAAYIQKRRVTHPLLPIKPCEKREYYPLSQAQQRLFMLQKMDPRSTAYNGTVSLYLNGPLDIQRLQDAFYTIIQRHETFRTFFIQLESLPVQMVADKIHFQIEISNNPDVDDFTRPFDLSSAPLLRVRLINPEAEIFQLMVDIHHIITDGTSTHIFISELSALYHKKTLAPVTMQFRDFALWQQRQIHNQVLESSQNYWLHQLSGSLPLLNLPLDYPRPSIQTFAGRRYRFQVPSPLHDRLRTFMKRSLTTLYMVLMAAFNILLNRYTQQEDIIIGTPVAGRTHSQFTNTIGFFLETLAIRSQPQNTIRVSQYLRQIKRITLQAFENQDYPFRLLVNRLIKKKDLSRNPLFDVMLNVLNHKQTPLKIDRVTVTPQTFDSGNAKLDLTLEATEQEDHIQMELEYCTALFKTTTMQRFAAHFIKVLETMSQDPSISIQQISIITAVEKREILESFNNTQLPITHNLPVHQQLEQQAAHKPHAVAVIDSRHSISFRELDNRANGLAQALMRQGVSPGAIVAVKLKPAIPMIVSLLAVLKTGAAWLPVDPGYPQERIDFMIQDSNSLICIDDEYYASYYAHGTYRTSRTYRSHRGQNAAYIIYTSGSSGRPKGVVVSHNNLIAYMHAFLRQIPVNGLDTVIQQASFSFDAFVEEVFPCLIRGAKLVIPQPSIIRDTALLVRYIRRHSVNIIDCSPLLLNQLNNYSLPSVHTFISGGDILKREYISQLLKTGTVYNSYGPTETTICATYHKIPASPALNIPIGKPIANYTVHILDSRQQLLPICIPGEICISGPGVALGYLNNPELTAEKFFIKSRVQPAPVFSVSSVATFYRTGDLGRWLPDGNIQFLGRIDRQVNIRGYRIELAEIENVLLAHPHITQVAVSSDEANIRAYFTAGRPVTAGLIRKYLSDKLPAYMIPAYLMQLAHMPLTPAGKIDFKSLPDPKKHAVSSGRQYTPAQSQTQQKLIDIWFKILNIEGIGIHHDFFELGGDSILSNRCVADIGETFSMEISLRDFFEQPTIHALSHKIETSRALLTSIHPSEEREFYPLSSLQQRFYFMQQLSPQSVALNIPLIIGIHLQVEESRLETIFKELIQRHQSLRTSFHNLNGNQLVQRVHCHVPFYIHHLSQEDIAGFVSPFDPAQAPLLRVALVQPRQPGQHHTLLMDMHHIISDGTSLNVLVHDFTALCEGRQLLPVRLQYKDYVQWLHRCLESGQFSTHEQYWLNTLSGTLPEIDLPRFFGGIDLMREPHSFEGELFIQYIDGHSYNNLKGFLSESRVTLYMGLLTAFNILLYRCTGEEDIIISSPVDGRSHVDFQDTTGLLMGSLMMRNFPHGKKSPRQLLQEVKENTFMAYRYQAYPFEEILKTLQYPQVPGKSPVTDISLNLLNMAEGNRPAEGLVTLPPPFPKTAKMDITLIAVEEAEAILLKWEYKKSRFKKSTIEQLGDRFLKVLELMVQQPRALIKEIDFLTPVEKKQLLNEFNSPLVTSTLEKSVVQLFREQAARTPDHIVLLGTSQISYRYLDEQSGRQSQALLEQGNNDIIAIMMEPGPEMILAILSVLKSGAAYLPIDPKTPQARVEFILKDSSAVFYSCGAAPLKTNHSKVAMNSAAYIIYTSGSTGVPKGVVVTHSNLSAYLRAFFKQFHLGPGDVVVQQASFAFDAFVEELYPVLLRGGKLAIPPRQTVLDVQLLSRYILRHQVTMITCSPAMLEQLNCIDPRMLRSISIFISGGDILKKNQFHKLLKRANVYNTYGPTETTVCATYYQCTTGDAEYPPIGQPIHNYNLHILDIDLNLLPVGIPGELFISGIGVTPGYLNNPELTAQNFFPLSHNSSNSHNSHNSYNSYNSYKTGDRGRWLPDGNIQFLGRMDNQVNIRGYRVELGEIKNRLLAHPSINEALVVTAGDTLCAYFTAAPTASPETFSPGTIRDFLALTLPGYMIPAFFITLLEFPRTAGGKIDRQALPAAGYAQLEQSPTLPCTQMEKALAALWAETLEIPMESVDIHQNFFHIGGHSLNATSLVNLIHKNLEVELPLSQVFKTPYIKSLSLVIQQQQKRAFHVIPPVEEQEYYPLSSAQKRLYFLQQMDLQSTAYNLPLLLQINETVDIEKLDGCLRRLIKRHESLRTSFHMIEGEPMQRVHPQVQFETETVVLPTHLTTSAFDLGKAPLIRSVVVKQKDGYCTWLLDMHHIITDGTSHAVLAEDFIQLYNGKNLEPLPLHYKDFSQWQNTLLASLGVQQQEAYWLNLFSQDIPRLEMPTDFKRPEVFSVEGEAIAFVLDTQESRTFMAVALENGATLYMAVLALLNVLFYRYTGQNDIVIGNNTAGRHHWDLQRIIGMFVNTLAMRNFPQGKQCFTSLLKQVITTTIEAFENQDLQFETLVESLDLPRDLSRNPLFDISMVVENFPTTPVNPVSGLTLSPASSLTFGNPVSKEDLTFLVSENEATAAIQVKIEYCVRLFKPATITRMIDHFRNLVREINRNPDILLDDIQLLSPQEQQTILETFNDTDRQYPLDKTIQQLFMTQVQQSPHRMAVVSGLQITYAELNDRSDRLAAGLQKKGVRPGDIVAIMLERSVPLLISIMAVFKAGAAYLPLDKQFPRARIDFMIEDSGAILCIDEEYWADCAGSETTRSYKTYNRGAAAYVIYTSGTMGKPKGVLVGHSALVNRLCWVHERYSLNHRDIVLQGAPVIFDVSVCEMFRWILPGARLCFLPPGAEKEPLRILHTLAKHCATTADLVPAVLSLLLQHVGEKNLHPQLLGLRWVFTGVETVKPQLVEQFNTTLNPPNRTRLINAYGPTESTVDVSAYDCTDLENKHHVPIGRPMANVQIYILDRNLSPQPIGIYGELCISGAALAMGYISNPQLTLEAFCSWSFNSHNSQKTIYKTGDLARWLPDGNIQFMGRMDQQVKIRGFRIELQEIEACLIAEPQVRQAVVIDRLNHTNGDRYLCAYVTGEGLDTTQLRLRLSRMLPDYMIPAYFVLMQEIPYTASGKLDRKKLTEPTATSPQAMTITAPRDYIEEQLLEIWSAVLAVPPGAIGIDSNFFRIGGHSLKATILISHIQKRLGVDLPLQEVFNHQTIETMAGYIRENEGGVCQSIEAVEQKEYYPLSSAQKRLYFIYQMDHTSVAYNMPMVVRLGKGADTARLEEALQQLLQRHESLRTSIHMLPDGTPVQRVHTHVDARSCRGYAKTGELLRPRPFDLSQAPLMKWTLVPQADGAISWFVDIHHIVSDGTSLTVLAEDFLSLYKKNPLPPLHIQYKDFARWQNRLLEGGNLEAQARYWLELYQDKIPRLDLPTDFKRPELFSFEGGKHEMILSGADSRAFNTLAARQGVTLYMNLLAVLNVLFFKYTGQQDIVLGSGIAGRRHADLQRVIGMFVNTLAMRNVPTAEKSYEDFLQEVRQSSIQAFENQDLQLEELVERLAQERDASRNPLFDVSLVLQNFRQVGEGQAYFQPDPMFQTLPGETVGSGDTFNTIGTAKLDLSFLVHETTENIHFQVEYYKGVYQRETIERMTGHLENIVKIVSANPQIKLQDIDLLTEEERRQILFSFNNTAGLQQPEGNRTLWQVFAQTVERYPHRAAVVAETTMTYRYLFNQAVNFARYLRQEKAVSSQELVALMLPSGVELCVAILGTLAAGCAYIPVVPSLPIARKKIILNDSNAGILVSCRQYRHQSEHLLWQCPGLHSYISLNPESSIKPDAEAIETNIDRELWEHVGAVAHDDISGGGWSSSYTGMDMSRQEMDEYGDNILTKLMPLLHKNMRVLEIGCASGISMFRIAPHVGLYYGTDFSYTIIEKNRQRIHQERWDNIKLSVLAAGEIHTIDERDFDLVILNSVVQVFGNYHNLRSIIRKAIDLLSHTGYLFMGDIMDLDSRQTMIAGLTQFKYDAQNFGKGYKTKTDFSTELFVSRSFWVDLCWEIPQLHKLDFSDKIHTIQNELTQFRYDTLITVNKSQDRSIVYVDGTAHQRNRVKMKHRDTLSVSTLTPDTGFTVGPDTGSGLACIIYTSGTSGIPKGVAVEHRGLLNYFLWSIRQFCLGPADVTLQSLSFSFDGFGCNFYIPLLSGGKQVMVVGEGLLDAENILFLACTRQITAATLVPTMYEVLLAHYDPSLPLGLRLVVLGGEEPSPRLLQKSRALLPGVTVINEYGPTEGSIAATANPHPTSGTTACIGKPIQNTAILIIGSGDLLQPIGVPGQLCITGIGVARGYLNNPELTAQQFTPMTYRSNKTCMSCQTLYKTGDSARWLPDGNIEFLGRMDMQVKIRGFRIELLEIESRLLVHPAVKQAVVTDGVDSSGDTYLCAYLAADEPLDMEEIRLYLCGKLPDYMVPRHMITLDKLPVTAGGKLDRRALPKPGLITDETLSAPRNKLERDMQGIWAEVLDQPAKTIGIDGNFFQIGGHSLKATVLISRIHKHLNIKIPLAELFKRPTISQLADYIKGAESDGFAVIRAIEKREYYPLSSAQIRLYFLHRIAPGSTAYNMPMLLHLDKNTDSRELQSALKGLIGRHESLRTSFHLIDGEPVQKVMTPEEVNMVQLQTFSSVEEACRTPFDLSRAPLLRSMFLPQEDGSLKWFVDMHHIISDGTSHSVLVEDFMTLRRGQRLPPLRIQYKDFAAWQNRLVQSGGMEEQAAYWLELYSDGIPRPELPVDFKRPELFSFEGGTYEFTFSAAETRAFHAMAARRGVTLYMNLSSLLNVLCFKYGAGQDIVMGCGIAGRRHADLQRIIGMFVNTLAMRNAPCAHKSYEDFLQEVKQHSIQAFENQDLQFEDLVERLAVERDASRNPMFDVSLVVENFTNFQPDPISTNSDDFTDFDNTAKMDLTFLVYETTENIHLVMEYYKGVYRLDTIKRMAVHLKNILNIVTADPQIKLQDIDLLTEEERRQILFSFNDTARQHQDEGNRALWQVFARTVERYPHRAAVVAETTITYQCLYNQTVNFALYLRREKDVSSQEGVALMLPAGIELCVAILGILAAGCAYVPVVPSLPEARKKLILNDANTGILVSCERYRHQSDRLLWQCPGLHSVICFSPLSAVNPDAEAIETQMDRELWEHVGATATDDISGGGWSSSYTGLDMSRQEMDEYGNNILTKVMPLLHDNMRVLEIGCASGISMFRIAPHVALYYGTDFSGTIIEKNRQRIRMEGWQNIKLAVLAAEEIHSIDENHFDLIIVNSVVQAFGNYQNLRNILRKAVNLLSDTGFLFMGDIMDLDSKESMMADLMTFKYAEDNNGKDYKTKTDFSRELFVSRSFWMDISWEMPELHMINFSDKIHTIENELTRFRYDVLITVDKSAADHSVVYVNGTAHPRKSMKMKHRDTLTVSVLSPDTGFIPGPVSGAHLAYIMYTSGTTGIPKGVAVEHRGLLNFFLWRIREYGLDHRDVTLQPLSYGFDGFGTNFYTPLLSGGKLEMLAEDRLLDFEYIASLILRRQVTSVSLVPAVYEMILAHHREGKPALRLVILGGERASAELLKKSERLLPHNRVINEYGPTEATITAVVNKHLTPASASCIGKPIQNTVILIIGSGGMLQPVGIPGQLCIAGSGLARGYLNNPELTAEWFVPMTNRSYTTSKTIYKTGDLARWLPDGNIEFLGRIDMQVKVRGVRIELPEIESRILEHPAVKQAVVIDRLDGSGDTYLCAWLSADERLDMEELRLNLSGKLPDYMVPRHIVILDRLPLDASGKLDRKALPEPGFIAEEALTAPCNKLETDLLEIWAEVLGQPAESIGTESNFFQVGGHSLKATILVSHIHREMNIKVPLAEVFRHSTIRQMAAYIQGAESGGFVAVEAVEKCEYYPLSSAQKRLYFLQQLAPQSTAYHMPMLIQLDKGTDTDSLQKALLNLVDRHESLRTSFHLMDMLSAGTPGEPVQRVHEAGTVQIEPFSSLEEARQTAFDLSRAPLLRSIFMPQPDGGLLWFVDMHHIISDGTSHTVLTEDFLSLTKGKSLPQLRIQYKDFAAWQNRLVHGGAVEKQARHWLELYKDGVPRLELPCDYPRPQVFTFAGDRCYYSFSQGQSRAFNRLGTEQGVTLYMNLSALLNSLFYRYTAQEDMVMGCGIAGRRHADLQQVIGMFVNTLAVRNKPCARKSYAQFLQEVKQQSILAFENQDLQFEELVERLVLERDASRSPMVDISLVVENFRQVEALSNSGNETNYDPLQQNRSAKFDLSFLVHESGGKINVILEYYTGIFKKETIQRMMGHLGNMLDVVTADPTIKLKDIQMLSQKERQQLLTTFAAGDPPDVEVLEKTIWQLFSQQVAATPHAPALVVDDAWLSYKQLHHDAQRLAAYLCREQDLRHGEPVAIMLPHGIDLAISMLALPAAGGCYVPMEPGLPEARKRLMLADTNCKILISSSRYQRQLDRLLWSCPALKTYICLDGVGSADKKWNIETNRELWEHVGEIARDDIDGGGWVSSFTGLPFSTREMDEYGDNILKKVLPLLSKEMRVLEIGCASGISMFRIAPHAALYYGTDFSNTIIRKNRRRVEEEGLKNIKLACMAAHQIEGIQEAPFHMVIINSVIQAFPDHDYLRRVIRLAIDRLTDQGVLFLGDIMDLDSRETLTNSLLKNRGYKVDFSDELFINRAFWMDLAAETEEIRQIDFSGKIHSIQNELTRYRYDTLIRIDKTAIEKKEVIVNGEARQRDDLKQKHRKNYCRYTAVEPPEFTVAPGKPADLVYILYTSGTSGVPKGVAVQQQGLVNFIMWRIRQYGFCAGDVTLQLFSYSFDGFGANFYSPLISGGPLVLVPSELLTDYDYIAAIVARQQVTTAAMIPTMYRLLLDHCEPTPPVSLRLIALAGEKTPPALVTSSKQMVPAVQLVNEYGPTEASIAAVANSDMKQEDTAGIGRPIQGTFVYILDKHLNLQPIGIPGELCIAGRGLAQGYLNNPELTSDRFLKTTSVPSVANFYKTGDSARWLSDGTIQLLGRIDMQVKIRGFRIELTGIETCLNSHPAVKRAIVSRRTTSSGDSFLAAYIVPAEQGPVPGSGQLKKFLRRQLPEYMIPAKVLTIEVIPLTRSGKVDHKKLPAPGREVILHGYVPPANQQEKKMTTIWAEVLEVPEERISVETGFFDMGGHSLSLIKVKRKIKAVFDEDIPIAKLFQFTTIRALAASLGNQGTGSAGGMSAEELEESLESMDDALELFDDA